MEKKTVSNVKDKSYHKINIKREFPIEQSSQKYVNKFKDNV